MLCVCLIDLEGSACFIYAVCKERKRPEEGHLRSLHLCQPANSSQTKGVVPTAAAHAALCHS